MSLFLGNLSPRILKDELEHVFQRFGRCIVNLKDGYGFAVYEFPPNAEKALRALRGKIICGEPIILSWSNKQPRSFQRFPRGGRFFENHGYERESSARREGGYFDRWYKSNGRDFKLGIKEPNKNYRKHDSDDPIVKESISRQTKVKDSIQVKNPDVENICVDGDGAIDLKRMVSNDRWPQDMVETSKDNKIDANGLEFDRYDPGQSHDKREDDEMEDHTLNSGGSRENYQEKTGKERGSTRNLIDFKNPRSRQTCYICQDPGHKMRDCPQYNVHRRKRFSRFDEFGFRMRRDVSPPRQSKLDVKESSGSRENGSGMKGLGEHPERGNYNVAPKNSKSRRNKGRTRGSETPRRVPLKRARISMSSRPCSDYDGSSKTASRSRSRSRSLKSSSMSHYSRSKSSSPGSTLPLSLSVSLGRPSNENRKRKGISDTAESKDALATQEQSAADDKDTADDTTKQQNASMVVRDMHGISSFKVGANLDTEDSQYAGLLEDGGLGNDGGKSNPVPKNSGVLSTEEMHKKDISSEDNIVDSARLWTREMVYYRRLQKGPITVKNYARRIAENSEFKIVDKFVRSSSGWGELSHGIS